MASGELPRPHLADESPAASGQPVTRVPSPRRRDRFVIRLWHRIGVFRMLSVGLLVVGVVATGYLSVGRQSQHRAIKSSQAAPAAEDQPQAAGLLVDERREITAASRDAQREAKAKADAEANAAAAAAKAAEEAAKKKQAPTP